MLRAALFLAVAWGIRRGQAGAAITGVLALVFPLSVAAARMDPAQVWVVALEAVFNLTCGFFLLRAAIELWPPRLLWAWLPGFLALAWFYLFLPPYVNPTASMEPALLTGDSVLVETATWSFGRTPRRGQILVFRYPPDRKQTFTKRVAGIPGDRLRIVNKRLFVNGSAIPEPYAIHSTQYVDGYRDNFPAKPPDISFVRNSAQEMLDKNVRDGEIVVPADRYFVLGDNRDASMDSRYWGFVSRGDIIGAPLLIYDSHDVGDPCIGLPKGAKSSR